MRTVGTLGRQEGRVVQLAGGDCVWQFLGCLCRGRLTCTKASRCSVSGWAAGGAAAGCDCSSVWECFHPFLVSYFLSVCSFSATSQGVACLEQLLKPVSAVPRCLSLR